MKQLHQTGWYNSISRASVQSQISRQLVFFLGVEVIPTNMGLFLIQHSYTYDLLSRYKLDGAKLTHTPLSTLENLQLHDGSIVIDSTIFRSVIGAFQYLSLT
jgi:hypothetical protein